MDAIVEAKKRIETIEGAIRGKKRRIKILKDDLAVEELETTYKNEGKMRSMKTQISNLERDISESLPAQIKDAKAAVKEAERAAVEAKRLLPEQEKLILEIVKSSKELLEALEGAQEKNQKLLILNDRFRAMESKTNSGMDLDECGGGFQSIKVLIQILKDEIDGIGRQMIVYPANFRI